MICFLTRYLQDGHAKKDANNIRLHAAVYNPYMLMHVIVLWYRNDSQISGLNDSVRNTVKTTSHFVCHIYKFTHYKSRVFSEV